MFLIAAHRAQGLAAEPLCSPSAERGTHVAYFPITPHHIDVPRKYASSPTHIAVVK